MRIPYQTFSPSSCERNYSTFWLIHTRLRNHLKIKNLHHLAWMHYNMRLKVHNLVDRTMEHDYYNPVDLSHIFNEDDLLDTWIGEAEEPMLDG